MKQKGHTEILKLNNGSEGFTLIEAVVSIALITILSIVVYSLFFSMSKISRYSEEQIKRYAVIKVIKENVANSIRKNTEIHGTGKKALDLKNSDSGVTRFENLPVKDLSGNDYTEYTFDLEYAGTNGTDVLQYKVSLKQKNVTANKFEFLFEVYKP